MSGSVPGLPAPRDKRVGEIAVGMNRDIRVALIGITVLILGLVVIAGLIPIGGAVIGAGKLGVESRVKRISHPFGGVIAEIYVRNGSRVKAGDPLIRFDDVVSGSQSDLSSLSVHQLLAQRARLEAERLGSGRLNFPEELVRSPAAGAAAAMRDETRLFALRQSEQSTLRAQLSARVLQLQRQILGYESQIGSLKAQAKLIEPELEGVRALWAKGLVTIARKNELERTAVALQGSIGALQAQIAQTQAQIIEAEEQRIQIDRSRRAEAGTQLATINNALVDQQMRSIAATDNQSRSLLRAGYAGIVDKLAFASIGEVVRAAEPILEIVPETDRLIIEAMISPVDVDQVRAGQPTRLRFSGLNAATSPELPGRVIFVAPDDTADPQTGMRFFPVRVELDAAALRGIPELQLRPGMPAEVYIETGSRSMLSYITKPFRDQFARAFRDN